MHGPVPPRRLPLTPWWVAGHLFVLAAFVACVSLGFWQLGRRADRQAANEQVKERIHPPGPLPLDGFEPTADTANRLRYTGVEVTGRYDPSHELLVHFRTYEGLPGFGVVTPLVTGDGTVLVDRGWVPLERGEDWPTQAGNAAAPTGEVTVTGWLAGPHPSRTEPEAPRPVEDKPGKVSDVSARQLRSVLPYERLYEMTLVADGPDDRFPAPVGQPDLSEGPHLGYAFQWFSFAAIGVIGWGAIIARSRRPRNPTTVGPDDSASAPQPTETPLPADRSPA